MARRDLNIYVGVGGNVRSSAERGRPLFVRNSWRLPLAISVMGTVRVLVSGPPGAGKAWLLRAVSDDQQQGGAPPPPPTACCETAVSLHHARDGRGSVCVEWLEAP